MERTEILPPVPSSGGGRSVRSKRFWAAGLWALLLALPGADTARATVLLYTGNDFTNTSAGGIRVTATFEFTTPLTDGAVLTLADVSSWSISAREFTMTNASTSFSIAEFTIGPDLLPASWLFAAEEDFVFIPNNLPETIRSYKGPESILSFTTQSADFLAIDDLATSSANLSPAGGSSANFSPDGSSAGTWSVVPEPATLWLLTPSILGILVRRR